MEIEGGGRKKEKKRLILPSYSHFSSSLQTIVRAVLAAAFRMETILGFKEASFKARAVEEDFENKAKVNGWDVSHLLIDGLEHRLEWKLK